MTTMHSNGNQLRFEGDASYIASPDLVRAVNMALFAGRPLLLKGEPGTGKTVLAGIIARSLRRPLVRWVVKSTTKAEHGRYDFDAVGQLSESHLASMLATLAPETAKAAVEKVQDPSVWIRKGPLWRVFEAEQPAVLLIDEIDKAELEFPNDLLEELDEGTFHCRHLQRDVRALHKPLIVITSNNEKELPPAFLRRCFFHYIAFPDMAMMKQIVAVHHPGLDAALLEQATQLFYRLREIQNLRKKPATSELIDWLRILFSDLYAELRARHGAQWLRHLPAMETLLKDEHDVTTVREHMRRDRL